jgi:hypothetical protein
VGENSLNNSYNSFNKTFLFNIKLRFMVHEIPNDVITFCKNIFQQAMSRGYDGSSDSKITECKAYSELQNSDDRFKVSIIQYATYILVSKHPIYITGNYKYQEFLKRLLILLFKSEVKIEEADLIGICDYLVVTIVEDVYWGTSHYHFPYTSFSNFIENYLQSNTLSDNLDKAIRSLIRKKGANKEDILFNERIDRILNAKNSDGTFDITHYIFKNDEFGQSAYHFFDENKGNEHFEELSALLLVEEFEKNTPTKKWEKRAEIIVSKIDKIALGQFITTVSDITITHLEKCHKQPQLWAVEFEYNNSQGYRYNDRIFASKNEAVLRRLVWLLPYLSEQMEVVEKVSALGLICYKKYSGVGGLLPSVGSASLYALTNLPNAKGVSQLTKYNQKISNLTIKKTIDKYLKEIALKSGKTPHEIEEESLPTFGLDNSHSSTTVFGDYKAVFNIISNTKIHAIWYDAHGKTFKSASSIIKEQFPKELKDFTAKTKLIQEQLSFQAKRIEEIYLLDRQWQYTNWEALYNRVGVLTFLAQKLVWEFETEGTKQTGMYQNGQFVNALGHPLSILPEKTIVRLWHPVIATMEAVSQWREFVFQRNIVQPFKQVYREIYIITDAELNTQSYSNRFAAHILKNYQFGALCKTREWMGYNQFHHDGGMPTKKLKNHNLSVEYWINHTNTEDYVATDQVCFLRNHVRIDLNVIPPIIFSETMRDVDMFVAVCSVGGDPAWRDNGGAHQYHAYWESYSFGNLNETAKVRKSILEKILPKLKIAKVAHIEDKFLVVKGTYRSYKIHLGSTNILMTPNDQYLCIVPDRSKPKDEGVYLPFEGDAGLSVIISKAFLLAADDKITDSTITRQILI